MKQQYDIIMMCYFIILKELKPLNTWAWSITMPDFMLSTTGHQLCCWNTDQNTRMERGIWGCFSTPTAEETKKKKKKCVVLTSSGVDVKTNFGPEIFIDFLWLRKRKKKSEVTDISRSSP